MFVMNGSLVNPDMYSVLVNIIGMVLMLYVGKISCVVWSWVWSLTGLMCSLLSMMKIRSRSLGSVI